MHRSRFKVDLLLGLILAVCFAFCFGFYLSTIILEGDLKKKPDWIGPSFCSQYDSEPPEIIINGEVMSSIKVGDEYNEQGAMAIDDCDEIILMTSGEVDTTTIGTYHIIYSAKDNSENQAQVERTVSVVPEYHGTIYLTFDDGPGQYTNELLDVLKKYNVKATFFVTGAGDDEMIAREYNEGHAVGLHTFSHDYAYVYRGVNEFFDDLYRVQERVKNITGFTSYLMRFPGGSSNTVSMRYDGRTHIMSRLVNEVANRGFTYFDWNVTSGDAGGTTSTDEVIDNVTSRLVEYGDSVVLQHDIKGFSVAAVEGIIRYGIANGYVFEKLSQDSFTAHHGVNN